MGKIDIKSKVQLGRSIAYGAKTSSANGTGVDVSDFHGAMAVIDAGAWTDGAHTFELQDSDDDSTYTAVDSTLIDGTEPVVDGAADDDQQYYLGYKGNKKYLRVAVTVSSATTGAIYGAYIVKGHPRDIPAN